MKKLNKKGFTLIELLAVIVILGLLMAIAIPSVTKYITQSRKKTLATTIGNYMSALTTEVNNMEYTLTDANTIYYIPVDCIALESGGSDPFGSWFGETDASHAYVLVQYDDTNSSYTYGFTFKDSAGYGLLPQASTKLSAKGDQIQTGLTGTVASGKMAAGVPTDKALASTYAHSSDWNNSGFKVDDTTTVRVYKSGTSKAAHGADTQGACIKANS